MSVVKIFSFMLFSSIGKTKSDSTIHKKHNDIISFPRNTQTVTSDGCAQYTSCPECDAATNEDCHWCDSDFTCHENGFWDSCWIQSQCLAVHQCVRQEPERIGLTRGRILLLCGGAVALGASLLWACFWYGRGTASSSRSNRRVWCFNTILILIMCILIGGILFFPEVPVFQMCTGRTAWRSILDNILDFDLNASFQILISIYNPNPVSVTVTEGTGDFLFNQRSFGSFKIQDPFELKALSVTDHFVMATLDPNDGQSLSIISAYALGLLRFTLNADFVYQIPLLRGLEFESSIKDVDFDLSTNIVGTLREMQGENPDLCQCTFF